MRAAILATLALLALPAGASAAGPAAVRVLSCVRAAEQADRSAVFEGDMRALTGTHRMQMRFTLLARPARRMPWKRVAGSRFDRWISSDPGKLRFVYDKRVAGLVGPAHYRVRVRFRWLDADGKRLARARRRSRVCRQPDTRPDLRIGAVSAAPGAGPGRREYRVMIRNAGRSAAGAFSVSLTPAGGKAYFEPVAGLAPGARTAVSFDAPACEPGSRITVVVDAGEQVDEAFEGDDTRELPCPKLP